MSRWITSSQVPHTAAEDYPELEEILVERPPLEATRRGNQDRFRIDLSAGHHTASSMDHYDDQDDAEPSEELMSTSPNEGMEVGGSVQSASPRHYYHVSPRQNRASIESEGLRVGKEFLWGVQPGIYLWGAPYNYDQEEYDEDWDDLAESEAYTYGEYLKQKGLADAFDVWQVNVDPSTLRIDATGALVADGAWVTSSDIPLRALRRVSASSLTPEFLFAAAYVPRYVTAVADAPFGYDDYHQDDMNAGNTGDATTPQADQSLDADNDVTARLRYLFADQDLGPTDHETTESSGGGEWDEYAMSDPAPSSADPSTSPELHVPDLADHFMSEALVWKLSSDPYSILDDENCTAYNLGYYDATTTHDTRMVDVVRSVFPEPGAYDEYKRGFHDGQMFRPRDPHHENPQSGGQPDLRTGVLATGKMPQPAPNLWWRLIGPHRGKDFGKPDDTYSQPRMMRWQYMEMGPADGAFGLTRRDFLPNGEVKPAGWKKEPITAPLLGYSAFNNPHELKAYMTREILEENYHDAKVVCFEGFATGKRGGDGEPLVMPTSDPPRIVRSYADWSTFVQALKDSDIKPTKMDWTFVASIDRSRLGRCYELSGRRILDRKDQDPAMKLVHGSIQGKGRPPIGHAWNVNGDGTIWEPATNRSYSPQDFADTFNGKPLVIYSVEEAISEMLRSKNFGPWDPKADVAVPHGVGLMRTDGHGGWTEATQRTLGASRGQRVGVSIPPPGPLRCAECKHWKGDHYDGKCSDCDTPHDFVPSRKVSEDKTALVEGPNPFLAPKESSWYDVQAKAVSIFRAGHVRIIASDADHVASHVQGEHGLYLTEIQFAPGTKAPAMWDCTCPWAAYSWGRSGRWKKYEGRVCSHAMATYYQFEQNPKPWDSPVRWDKGDITYYEAPNPNEKEWRAASIAARDVAVEDEGEPNLWDGLPNVVGDNPAPGAMNSNTVRSFHSRPVPDQGMPVAVYRDLSGAPKSGFEPHTSFSVKSKNDNGTRSSTVQVHARHLMLSNAAPEFDEAARQKAIDTGKRGVHAYIGGNVEHWLDSPPSDPENWRKVSYFPDIGHFFFPDTRETYEGSDYAYLNGGEMLVKGHVKTGPPVGNSQYEANGRIASMWIAARDVKDEPRAGDGEWTDGAPGQKASPPAEPTDGSHLKTADVFMEASAFKAYQERAKSWIAADPKPTPEEVAHNQELLANEKRAGGELRGNSHDRKARTMRMLKAWGDGKTCHCVYCGREIDASTLTQDKIYTEPEGGRYKFNNLLPACYECNSHRNDTPITQAFTAALIDGQWDIWRGFRLEISHELAGKALRHQLTAAEVLGAADVNLGAWWAEDRGLAESYAESEYDWYDEDDLDVEMEHSIAVLLHATVSERQGFLQPNQSAYPGEYFELDPGTPVHLIEILYEAGSQYGWFPIPVNRSVTAAHTWDAEDSALRNEGDSTVSSGYVKARVDGWDEAQQENQAEFPNPDVPTLEGVPEWVVGDLQTQEVNHGGIHYTKYIVDGYDVDPQSIQKVGEANV